MWDTITVACFSYCTTYRYRESVTLSNRLYAFKCCLLTMTEHMISVSLRTKYWEEY